MSKHNLIAKTLKKHLLSINNTIESYFSKLNILILKIKKTKLQSNNRAFLTFGIIFISVVGYFLLPTVYDENIIQSKIKNQIIDRYNIEVRFNEKIRYGLFPKPYFLAKNLSILQNQKEIAEVKKFKVFISINRFFAINQINIKDIIFDSTDFNINQENIAFFKKLLFAKPSENYIKIRNSNIFFKNLENEILFLSKVYKSKFFYDEQKLNNNLISKSEIFNLPFVLKITNDTERDQLFVDLQSKKIRLNFKNQFNYKDEIKKGLLDISFINKKTFINYIIDEKSLNFSSKDKRNSYNGLIDFKPFYLDAKFNYENLTLKHLLDDDSFLIEIIQSQILNNKNLNMKINFALKNIVNIQQLNNLNLNAEIIEGDINFSNSHVMWNDDFKITLKNSLLSYDKNQISLIGKAIIVFENIDDFYSSFQIKKFYRKKIEKIEFDFVYNINSKQITFDNPKIDNSSNLKLEKFIQNFNSQNKKFFNKITFKTFVNNFFSAYAG